MPQPVILAIETSQREGGVALRDADGDAHVEMLRATKRHDDDLMPAIDRMCSRAGVASANLSAVGISIGPGGFTGLRIAVSTAKMLALAHGAAIVAVPSALVVAEGVDEAAREIVGGGPMLVALACKRETFWATRVVFENGAWRLDGEAALARAADVALDSLTAVVADEYLPATLRDRCAAEGAPIVEPRFDPLACLAVSARMLAAQETSDPLKLAPLYAREPEAAVLWRKREQGPDGAI